MSLPLPFNFGNFGNYGDFGNPRQPRLFNPVKTGGGAVTCNL
jgi:hypothetical protein